MAALPKLIERKRCPPQFQDRITRIFGRNKYGDPLFKIVWGQSEFHRMGNIWRDKYGNERRSYAQRFLCDGTPCWNILRWYGPKHWLSPRAFYANTWDDFSKLYMMGEYPWRGRYEVVTPLRMQDFRDGKMVIIPFPLSSVLIDKTIPYLRQLERLSVEQRAAEEAAAKAALDAEETKQIAEMMMENMPAYWGPVSYSRQGIRTSLIQRKMDTIEKAWKAALKNDLQYGTGFAIGNAPRRVN